MGGRKGWLGEEEGHRNPSNFAPHHSLQTVSRGTARQGKLHIGKQVSQQRGHLVPPAHSLMGVLLEKGTQEGRREGD